MIMVYQLPSNLEQLNDKERFWKVKAGKVEGGGGKRKEDT